MSNDRQLLIDYTPWQVTPELIKESRDKNDGRIILKSILQRADALNQNGRIYPRDILEREMRNYQKFINENRALGELDHPDSSVIELKNVSHCIRETWWEGDTVWGRLEVLNTPSGKILQSLLESGILLGISSRGVGSTKKQGGNQIVQDDYQIICFDSVSDPSVGNAFMLKEHLIKDEDIRKIFTRSDRIDRRLNDILFSVK